MAIIYICGFETGDTSVITASGNAGASGVAPSIVTTPVRSGSGLYAAKVNVSAQDSSDSWLQLSFPTADGTLSTSTTIATSYHRFYFRLDTIPSSGREAFFYVSIASSGVKLVLAINSTGTISVQDYPANTVSATSTAAIATGTWYRAEVMSTTSASPSAYEFRLYNETGLLLDTVSGTMAQSNSPCSRILFGKAHNISSRAVMGYIDDYAVSDSGWIGAGACIRLAPIAEGSTQQWTAGTNGSDHLEVDEVPTSSSDYVKSTGAAADKALFLFEDPAGSGVSDAINAVMLYASTAEDTSVTSANKLRIESGASNVESSAYNGTTSYASRFLVSNTDPDTSAAWTLAGLRDAEAGSIEGNAVAMRMAAVCMMVDYAESADTGTDYMYVTGANLRVDTKIVKDRGSSTSSTGGAVTVNFNKTFADIISIDVFPISTNPTQQISRVINFVDAADPTSFTVSLYDNATGLRIALPFGWTAEGVLKYS